MVYTEYEYEKEMTKFYSDTLKSLDKIRIKYNKSFYEVNNDLTIELRFSRV